MKKAIPFVFLLIILSTLPLILAGTYGNLRYGLGLYNVGETAADAVVNISLNDTSVDANTQDPVAVFGHINLSNGTNVSRTLVNLYINGSRYYVNNSKTEFNATDWNLGTAINVTVNPRNITLNLNGSNQYPNATGNFTSQVVDTRTGSNFTFISWRQEVPYQTEIGRSVVDGNTVGFGGINTSGLVLLLHFNNESGLGENNTFMRDFSIDVNSEKISRTDVNCSGTACPSYNFTNPKFGRAGMWFDDSNDYIDVQDGSNFSFSNFTLSSWVYQTGTPEALVDAIIDNRDANSDGYAMDISPTSNVSCRYNAITVSSRDSIISSNRWYHLACVADGTNVIAYVNGVNEASLAQTGTISETTNMRIGARGFTSPILNFDGLMDEIAVWNRSLSSQEILNLYKRGALRLNLSVRSCDDSACSGESFSEVLTNSSGIKLNESITPIDRYFQYKAVLNTEDVNLTPVFYNITINYTTLATDARGDYNFTFKAPSTTGTYTIKVNTTFNSIDGEGSVNLTVSAASDTTPPSINITNLNASDNIKINNVLNISAFITGTPTLVNFTFNLTANDLYNFSYTVTGDTVWISQNITVNLTRGNVINASVVACDVSNNCAINSTLITVANTPPPQVTLIAPNTNNQTINRTPTFTWNNVTDADNDSLLFNILIICVECSSDNRDANTTKLNFTPSELLNLGDENFYYNWSVRAIDNLSSETSFGAFSEIRNITINSFVSLSLLTSTVDFGSVLNLGQNDNTTDDSPAPIVMDNDGNVFVNVSIYAEDDLWESIANPTDKFQFKIANVTSELNSFNWTAAITSFTNLPAAAVIAVVDLNYSDATDSAEADLKVEVPSDEPAGTKQSKVVFEAKRSR